MQYTITVVTHVPTPINIHVRLSVIKCYCVYVYVPILHVQHLYAFYYAEHCLQVLVSEKERAVCVCAPIETDSVLKGLEVPL